MGALLMFTFTYRGHEWETTPERRQKYGCPFCAGRRLSPDARGHSPVCRTPGSFLAVTVKRAI